MSQYANYTKASKSYDTTRVPVGVEIVLDCLARTGRSPGEQCVLEAGCGTGNYLQALCGSIGELHGIDVNEGMLEQARRKLGEEVELTCGSILGLPFEDERFDGVVCNQVIHHLDEGPGADDDPRAWPRSSFPNVARFLGETHRVLRPGGALVLNFTTHDQNRRAFWWANLIPTAVERMNGRHPSLDQLQRMLVSVGFEVESIEADLAGVLQGKSYWETGGPFTDDWRAGDSTWSLTTDAELASALGRIEQMIANDTIQKYLAERESDRLEVGQSTFVCGRKQK